MIFSRHNRNRSTDFSLTAQSSPSLVLAPAVRPSQRDHSSLQQERSRDSRSALDEAFVVQHVPLHKEDRSRSTEAKLITNAMQRTQRWLYDRQLADGHWRGSLEGDTILESEYVIILAWAGKLAAPEVKGAAQRILQEQLPSGGWAIYPGGPVDCSASVKAYLALKLTGHAQDSEPLNRARLAIARAGGPWTVNSFTRFYLALLGQMPYSACPAVPPEMVLLPSWFPINLHRVSAWSRTMIVPLSLIWAFKPVRKVLKSEGIGELFATPEWLQAPQITGENGIWTKFFRVVDRIVKMSDAIGFQPLRSRAVAECRRWMLQRFEGSDGLGAIFPPIVWSIVALRAMGCDDESAEVQECWRQLAGLVEVESDGSVRVEPCRSPVWDTAITLRSLCDAGRAVKSSGADRCLVTEVASVTDLDQTVDWLLDREVRTSGDWARRTDAIPSGWCFEYANRFYPDVDDTAMVLIALSTWQQSVAGLAAQGTIAGLGRVARVHAALSRATPWLEALQNSDGGWGAFDRDNNCEILCKVPFADHNAMIDPSSPDLAGRVLEAFGKIGLRIGHASVDRACDYLRLNQEADGSWFGRWGINFIYGTWQAIEGLRSVGVPANDPAIVAAVEWLVSRQQSDGGWGESPASYSDPAMSGRGTPTASQTAWAVAAFIAAERHDSRPAQRGVQWLVERQCVDGAWEENEFTGTGFPKVFYLRYHYYPIYFPLMALARFLTAEALTAAGRSRKEQVA
ncbi:MAG: squalene--hopene cyclase [Planctomycetaceae bacterium]|nr:MAG: squalene--hopene cyclase [Planctomycetaceae bacterium]